MIQLMRHRAEGVGSGGSLVRRQGRHRRHRRAEFLLELAQLLRRLHLLLAAPLGPSVLEPNLRHQSTNQFMGCSGMLGEARGCSGWLEHTQQLPINWLGSIGRLHMQMSLPMSMQMSLSAGFSPPTPTHPVPTLTEAPAVLHVFISLYFCC